MILKVKKREEINSKKGNTNDCVKFFFRECSPEQLQLLRFKTFAMFLRQVVLARIHSILCQASQHAMHPPK